MTASIRTVGFLAIGLVGLTLVPLRAGAASLDGSTPFLCAISTVMECDGTGQCDRHTAPQHRDFPSFLRVNVAQRLITDARNVGRRAEITSWRRLDGRLILYGGENARGWSATIAEDTARMSAGLVADEFTFALFGACTAP
jgi:hypothetical protein